MLGHNNPPQEFARVDSLVETADRWKEERKVIETDEIADKAAAFLNQLRDEAKEIEKTRKAEKQPHIDAGKAVDAKFKTQVERLTASANIIKGILTPYLEKKEAERQEAERKAQAEALAAQKAADEAAKKAKGIDAEIAAAAAADNAAQMQKDAHQIATSRVGVSSSMGGRAVSLRTVKTGEIVDQSKVYRKFKNAPSVIEALQKLVNAEVRAGRTVPGVKVIEERSAV